MEEPLFSDLERRDPREIRYQGQIHAGQDPRGVWVGCLIIIFLLLLFWGGAAYLLYV